MEAGVILDQLGIQYERLTNNEIYHHKRTWINHYVPINKQLKAAAIHCFPRFDGFRDYLWHAFSYELINGVLSGDEANVSINSVQINEAILISNWEDAGFHIYAASALTAELLHEIVDVVITSTDFKWTYAKTHESDIGPFFLML